MGLPAMVRQLRHLAALALAAGTLASVTGCASVQVDATSASPQVIERLRGSNLQPLQAGRFTLAPGRPPEMDRSLSGLRGSALTPAKGSFAQLLKDTFVLELTAAGLYDAGSPLVVEAELTDSRVDAAVGTGTGRLAAHFTVKRSGALLYGKELAVDASWESSFMGAVAIPMAMDQYRALYKALVLKLTDDPDFRKATQR